MSDSTMIIARSLVDFRDRTIQKARIAFNNRLSAIERDADTGDYAEMIERYFQLFDRIEKELDKDLKALGKDLPIVQLMTNVKGVGPTLAIKVAAMIDIDRADTVSALWCFAGYGVTDGKRDRPVKGEPLKYNARLKTTCYLVGTSFLKAKSPYADVYYEARNYYDEKRPDWTDGHKHAAAMRKAVKLWLSHLWQVWRELENLPITDPYIFAAGEGPHHMRHPGEFGWYN